MSQAPVVEAPLRGVAFFKGTYSIVKELLAGDPLGLLREPENPHDYNAVIVTNVQGMPFAYVAREKAAILSKWMDEGWVYTAKVIQPPNIVKRRSRLFVETDSFLIRCTPIQPIALKKKTIQSISNRVKELMDV